MYDLHQKYIWKKCNNIEDYLTVLDSTEIKSKLNLYRLTKFPCTKDGVNLATQHLNNILDELATKSNLKIINYSKKITKNKPSKEKWYDNECVYARKQLRLLSNQKHREPHESQIRVQYHQALKYYKTLINKKKRI